MYEASRNGRYFSTTKCAYSAIFGGMLTNIPEIITVAWHRNISMLAAQNTVCCARLVDIEVTVNYCRDLINRYRLTMELSETRSLVDGFYTTDIFHYNVTPVKHIQRWADMMMKVAPNRACKSTENFTDNFCSPITSWDAAGVKSPVTLAPITDLTSDTKPQAIGQTEAVILAVYNKPCF